MPFQLSIQQCQYTTRVHTPVQRLFFRDYTGETYQKGKPIWILLKQETVSGSGISWAICKSAPRSKQTPCQHPTTQFFTGRIPFLLPNQQRQSTVNTLKQWYFTAMPNKKTNHTFLCRWLPNAPTKICSPKIHRNMALQISRRILLAVKFIRRQISYISISLHQYDLICVSYFCSYLLLRSRPNLHFSAFNTSFVHTES